MDSVTLFTVQGPLGLGYSLFGDIHRRVHSLCRSILAQRAGLQCGSTVDRELRRRSNRYHRPDW